MLKYFRVILFSMFLIISSTTNSFSRERKINGRNFGKIIQGVWTVDYYYDTLGTTLLYNSGVIDTLNITKTGKITERRTVSTDQTLISKQNWKYISKERKMRVTYLISGGKDVVQFLTVLKMNKDEVVIEWYGAREGEAVELRMESRYRRVKSKSP